MLEGVRELRTEADVAWLRKDLDAMTEEPVVYIGKTAVAGWAPQALVLSGIMSSAPRNLFTTPELPQGYTKRAGLWS